MLDSVAADGQWKDGLFERERVATCLGGAMLGDGVQYCEVMCNVVRYRETYEVVCQEVQSGGQKSSDAPLTSTSSEVRRSRSLCVLDELWTWYLSAFLSKSASSP